MVEISHQQARRLLRQKLDQRLPDAQWAPLEVHLEGCVECRVYNERLGTMEREIRRSLRAGWDSARYHTTAVYGTDVLLERKRRAVHRQRITWAGAVLLLGLTFFLTGGFERLRERGQPQAVVEVAPPTATPLPTPAAGEFRGVVAYEAITGAQSDIFLLNPGEPGGPVNLTDNPARDTSPAWSPDGEWLAFLSDRDSESGQMEVFVTNVAGSRVAQLTGAPGMLWEGPISWSADGKHLVLTGVRLDQGGQSRIYIVPLVEGGNGSALATGAYSLPGTRGGFAPEFAPFSDRLAFAFSDSARSGVMITSLDGGLRVSVDWEENPNGMLVPPGSSLDWSADGASLAYTVSAYRENHGNENGSTGPGAQVMVSRDPAYSVAAFPDLNRGFFVAQSRWPGAFRAVGWTPAGAVMYIEDIDDARADQPGAISDCWNLYTRDPGTRGLTGVLPAFWQGGLCVESGLERASWTPDGEWLVVLGRTNAEVQAEQPRGLYAMQLAGPAEANRGAEAATEGPRIVRIGDAEAIVGTPVVRPALKRYQNALNINPRSIDPRADAPTPVDASTAPGEVLFAQPQGSGSVIVRMSPDGTGGKLLYSTEEVARCPAFSPDGSRVAFVSGPHGAGDKPEPGAIPTAEPQLVQPGEDVYVMSREGGDPVRISVPAQAGSRYGCLVWSPDGRWLAAPVEEDGEWALAVIPSRGGPARTTAIGRPAGSTGPRWTPDSNRVLMTHTPEDGPGPLISAFDLPSAASEPLRRKDLRALTGWSGVSGMAVLTADQDADGAGANTVADAWQIGLIAQYGDPDGNLRAVLRRLSMTTGLEREGVVLGVDDSSSITGPPGMARAGSSQAVYLRSLALQRGGMLSWQADNGLGIILRGGPGADKKTVIFFYDQDERNLREIVALDDVLYGAAWSPDGGWVILSAESGLWLVDVQAALDLRSRPLWISPEPVFDLDWGE